MSIQLIKNAVKTNLDALVTAETLAGAEITDIKRSPLAAETPAFPYAYLMPPAVSSEVLDNRKNLRTYTFEIMVLFKAVNLASTTELEEKIEAILTKFDNDPTLGGTALGGVLPVSSAPEPLQHNGKDLIMVIIQIQAKEPVLLNFA